MAKNRKFYFQGKWRLKSELLHYFEITRSCFDARLKHGWKIVGNDFIPPPRKEQEYHKDRLIFPDEARALKTSFIGDPEISDSLYC